MRSLATSLFVSIAALVSVAGCTAETASAGPDELPSETVDPQGVGPCTSGGVVVSCTEPICALPNSTLGRGPAFGYYSAATCDSYARACGKQVIAYTTRYVASGIVHTSCYFL